jgi:hypothetical protein
MSRDRGYNREQRERVIKNRKRLMKDTDLHHRSEEDGRYAKRHPYDCGKTDCGVCHPHKKNKACASKNKDEHLLLEEVIDKETHAELTVDMCDFRD